MQHNDLSEQVFDSLVQEMITGQRPPDLTSRILAAIDRESQSNAAPSQLLAPPLITSSRQATQTQPSTASSPNVKAVATASSGSRTFSFVALAVVATLLFGFLGWRWIDRANDSSVGPGSQIATGGNVLDVGNNSKASSGELVGTTTGEENGSLKSKGPSKGSSSPRHVPEVIDSLPFELDSKLSHQGGTDLLKQPRKVAEKLSQQQIVAQLDQQLESMWQGMDVSIAGQLTPVELAQQISQALTGHQVSESELDQIVDDKKQSLKKADLIRSATSSMAFQRLWSERLVQYWTGRAQGETERSLVDSLSQRMREEKRWNVVVAELLGGDLSSEDSASSKFLSLLAGGENHRLVECIGRGFMNQQVACMRCHRLPDAENSPANQQATYWSLVATLKGVEGHGAGKQVDDRQETLFVSTKQTEPGVYFELPSGALKQAFATLPDGTSWKSIDNATLPRKALANWIRDSQQFDQATVNTVWQLVFGRPLMPQNIGVDAVALEHRQQMLEFLAEQFDLADHDLSQLVGWVVSSRAFAVRPDTLTREQWQQLDQEKLDQWQLSDWTFATGAKTSRPTNSRARLQDNLKYVVQWRASGKPQPVLSQPSPDLPKLSPDRLVKNLKNQRPTFSSSFAVHGLRHTMAEEAFVDRLLRSEKLTWQERVQHVVGLTGANGASDDTQFSAKELLQHHSGDSKAALLDLLWATQNSQL